MNVWVRSVSIGCGALFAFACGATGSGDDSSGGSGTGSGATSGSLAGTGAVSSGGSDSSAGNLGSSGTLGGGGVSAGGTGGGGLTGATKAYTFDNDLQAWLVQYTSAGMIGAGTMKGMAATAIPKTDVMASWTGTDGDPSTPLGAMQLNIPYTSASQYVGVGISLSTKVDLTGKVITANVKVLSGLGDPADLMTNPGGAKLYVKSGPGYIYASGEYTNVTVIGSWIPITFDLSVPPSYEAVDPDGGVFDASDIREIGLQLDTGGTTTTATAAVDLIDSVQY
jgi:hypothetical protein